jgi:hypothetical protein
MATNVKVLFSIPIISSSASAPTSIYSPTGTKSAVVTAITLLNNGGTTDVFLTTGSGATPPVFYKTNLASGAPSAAMSDVVTLTGVDAIKGYLSLAGGSVQCFVFGIERD